MNYNNRIKYVRKQRKLSQKDMADAINIKQQQYERYENGKNTIPVDYLIGICKTLNVSSDYILGLSDEYKELN